tara:strand:- start:418 stop:669 length:252 start_codon:yes stop_codon:yes gene_type:complete
MGRRRNNDTHYQLIVKTPMGERKQYIYDNINDMADGLNKNFFSSFPVITNTMISNWIHYPTKARREYARQFNITKVYDLPTFC